MSTPVQIPAPALGPDLVPGLALYQLAIGHYYTQALCLAARLGVPDLLAQGARTADQLAHHTGTDAASLRRVLRLLASVGVFAENEQGAFSLLPLGEALRADVPGSARAMVLLFAGPLVSRAWAELEWVVRTGQPAFCKEDPTADPFTVFARDPEAAANFDRAMATFAPQTAAAVAAAYDFSGFAQVADVGGGNGTLLLGILAANPRLRGIVFDLPPVIERARPSLEAAGLGDRCRGIAGSFFDSVPQGLDAYLLKHVIHDWNHEDAVRILQNVRRAMAPGARVLIVEGIYPERIDGSLLSRGAAANDVNMLVSVGGRQRSEREFRELYAASGLRLTRVVPAGMVCVIEGEAA